METSDPDDFLALLLLAGHPRVDLRAVCLMPGTDHQVGLAAWTLERFGIEAPIGAFEPGREGRAVSPWHYRAYGDIPPRRAQRRAADVLRETCDASTTLITGAPLKNAGAAIAAGPGWTVGRLVAQGGFAGEGLVAPERQLPEFRGRLRCPSYNLDGDLPAARAVLDYGGIEVRRFVSKNVCHGVRYDQRLDDELARAPQTLALRLIRQGMAGYLERRPEGKKLHDPLAACCAIDEAVGEWAEVELERERDGWGARPATGSGTWITVGYDRERFVRVLSGAA